MVVTHNKDDPQPPSSSASGSASYSYRRYVVEEDVPPESTAEWFNYKLVSHLVYNSISLIFSPLSSLFTNSSNSSNNYKPNDDDDDDGGETIQYSCSVQNSSNMLKKVGLGFLGAAHACMVLMLVAAVAVAVGVGLVRFWLEEPIFLKEKLHFDYTHIHPYAVYSFKPPVPTGSGGGLLHTIIPTNKQQLDHRVPIGHTFQVSVALLMPESEYNRQVGVFQLTAEVVGEKGEVIAKASEACMLRFRSLPIRVMRVLVLGVPVLLGMSNEAQKLRIGGIVKHKEVGNYYYYCPRTDSIRVTLIPRAGTSSPPQLYEAEIIVQSHLPFFKHLLHRWKWTLYVWASMNIYIMMLLIMLCFCKPLLLSGPPFILRSFQQRHTITRSSGAAAAAAAERWSNNNKHVADQAPVINRDGHRTRRKRRLRPVVRDTDDNIQEEEEEEEVSELLRRLQRSRNKRRAAAAALLAHPASPLSCSTASTISVNPSDIVDDDSS